jgi:endonuclease/exonuclease/phosphatase family metal-dependent hydrolase
MGHPVAMRLRVLTMNIQNPAGDPERQARVNQELRRLAPDLVTLQEVGNPGARDQLAELLEGTGLVHSTHQAEVLSPHPHGHGTAIATRWPHRVAEIREHPGDPHWWTLAELVDLPQYGDQLFIAPSTAWQLDHELAREHQALEVAEIDARHRTAVPTIIAGDLNAAPDSASVRFLTGLQSLAGQSVRYHDAWQVAGSGPGWTWSVDNPLAATEIDALVGQPGHRRRIDYVFVGSAHAHPDIRTTVVSAELVGAGGVPLSDHYGLVAELSLLS